MANDLLPVTIGVPRFCFFSVSPGLVDLRQRYCLLQESLSTALVIFDALEFDVGGYWRLVPFCGFGISACGT